MIMYLAEYSSLALWKCSVTHFKSCRNDDRYLLGKRCIFYSCTTHAMTNFHGLRSCSQYSDLTTTILRKTHSTTAKL